jgi:hypothetical protein
MRNLEGPVDEFEEGSRDRTINFVTTLIVATLMVALTAYVLSFALLGQGANPSQHRAALASIHARS